MANIQSQVLLLFLVATTFFSAHFVVCSSSDPSASVEERSASIQVLGLFRIWEYIRQFGQYCLPDTAGLQDDSYDIANEFEGHPMYNGPDATVQFGRLRSIWERIRDCVRNIINGGTNGGQNSRVLAQQVRQNWAITSDYLDQILNPSLPPTDTPQESPFNSVNTQQANNNLQDWSILCNVMDVAMNGPDDIQNTPTATQQQAAQTEFFSSLGDLARRYWPTARECLNDFLSDNENEEGDSAAIASEFERIWKRETTEVASSQIRRYWPTIRDCVDRFVNGGTSPDDNSNFQQLNGQNCYNGLYVMAFTGGSRNSFTIHPPFIELTVDGETERVQLYDLPGIDYSINKGDLWKIELSTFGFLNNCIERWAVDAIAVAEGGNDGWLIDSIVTFLRAEDGTFTLLSSDIDVYQWIDGNGGPSLERFNLTMV